MLTDFRRRICLLLSTDGNKPPSFTAVERNIAFGQSGF
ncbi:hypothetical protein HDF16_005087 [Granulicella aggregans]|uniref:Uncharacterized protein n=1 Tax=Granulicella aggregans TaxID=474949 RepID=A0A7W7ZIB1_9BACT|nr:hypothetical protein [Granulicella aggregans]